MSNHDTPLYSALCNVQFRESIGCDYNRLEYWFYWEGNAFVDRRQFPNDSSFAIHIRLTNVIHGIKCQLFLPNLGFISTEYRLGLTKDANEGATSESSSRQM